MTEKKPWERGPFHYESYDMFYRLQDGQGKTVEPLDVEAMVDEIKRLQDELGAMHTEGCERCVGRSRDELCNEVGDLWCFVGTYDHIAGANNIGFHQLVDARETLRELQGDD